MVAGHSIADEPQPTPMHRSAKWKWSPRRQRQSGGPVASLIIAFAVVAGAARRTEWPDAAENFNFLRAHQKLLTAASRLAHDSHVL